MKKQDDTSPILCKEDGAALTDDQKTMVKVLNAKKLYVISELVSMLDYRNSDIEQALNTSVVLNELIEIEKTFELFF